MSAETDFKNGLITAHNWHLEKPVPRCEMELFPTGKARDGVRREYGTSRHLLMLLFREFPHARVIDYGISMEIEGLGGIWTPGSKIRTLLGKD